MASIEWELIRGTSKASKSEPGPSRIHQLKQNVLDADFRSVLLSPEAKSILADPYLLDGLSSAGPSTSTPRSPDEMDVSAQILVAVALLHAFVQLNWTGPDLGFTALDFLPVTSLSLEELNSASLPHLTLGGEPAYHLCSQPILFLLSLRLLNSLSRNTTPPVTLPWWILRAHLVHQSLLDEHVPLPSSDLQAVKNLPLPDDADLLASREVELGLYYHSLDQDKAANAAFLSAAKASGLEFELSGALGKRTKFQQEALSQLVLLAESRQREGEMADPSPISGDSGLPDALPLNDETLLEETEFTKLGSSSSSSSRLAHLDPSDQPPLYPLDQALLLSLCLSQHNNAPSHGLTASQMLPFLTRVVQHPRNWSIHTTALLLRARLESTRSRTVERSALQLSALIEQMPTSDSSPAERLRYFHQLPLPSKWEMERELAKRYASLGVVRSALEVFTRLEMWEDAVHCLQRMEKEDEAERIVRDLLEGKKLESDLVQTLGRASLSDPRKHRLTAGREAKLWCLLGDLALSSDKANKNRKEARDTAIEMYQKAWDVSEQTSSRAMRSMGSIRVSGAEFEEAIPCFQAALRINPLFARSWFTLGVCFVRLERWEEARDAFKRDVGVDEEDAEGWNNLAAVYLRLSENPSPTTPDSRPAALEESADEEIDLDEEDSKPRSTFENKSLAFRALRQGLRYAYTNWRMWQNYLIVCIDIGELAEAVRAMTRLVEDLASKDPILALDVDVLDKLVDAVVSAPYAAPADDSMPTFGLHTNVERLFEQTILPRISDNARVWRAYARLQRWQEDWAGAMESALRSYRFGPASDPGVETNVDKFREGCEEVREIVDVLEAIGPKAAEQVEKSGGKQSGWKFTARGLIRTFMGRTRTS